MTTNSGLKAKIHDRQAVTQETYTQARNAVIARPAFPKLEVGQRIRFDSDRMSMTVRLQSPDHRFAILTRPFPLRDTVLYTVLDFTQGVRGTSNNRFGPFGYETDEGIRGNMDGFQTGDLEVSYRRWVWLRYTDIQPDPRTQQILGTLREITRHAPPRTYNNFHPRTAAETLNP